MKKFMMKNVVLKIGKQIGGIEAITEDLKSVKLVGQGVEGVAELSYANMQPYSVIINVIKTNPYNDETNEAIDKLLDKRGLSSMKRKSKKKNYQFFLTEDQKNMISNEINRRYEDFNKRLMEGGIKITAKTVGVDFPHTVLSIDNETENWDYFYFLTEEKCHMYNYYKWGKAKDGDDVTSEVIEKIIKIDKERSEKLKITDYREEKIKASGKTVVRLNQCWECGAWRILGGRNSRLSYETFQKAKQELAELWQKSAEKDLANCKELLSSYTPKVKTEIPGAAAETNNFVFFVVSRTYDDC